MNPGAQSPAEALADAIGAATGPDGVRSELAFGVPGGGPNLDVIGALADRGIRFVLAHGETAACIMASVHGHLTGSAAIAVVTRGPGAASAVNGAAQATLDRHPLILVTDTVPASAADRVPHQRLAQTAMLAPVCKRSATLGSNPNPAALAAVLNDAIAAPAGAVHLDYDASTEGLHEPASPSAVDADNQPAPVGRAEHDRAVALARDLIGSARHPVVIVGLGALAGPNSDAAGERTGLVEDLERLGAPVLTTYQAIGTVPTEHDQWAGLFTNGASERPLLDQADLVLTVGLDVVEPIPAPWPYRAPIVSLASTPTVDPYMPIQVELVGHPTKLLSALISDQPDRPATAWKSNAGRIQRQLVRTLLRDDGSTSGAGFRPGPVEVVELAAARVPDDATTTVDAGAHFLAIMPFWPAAEPRQLLISNGLATMGYAVPAAIGAALARPGKPVACLVGDGGLGMTLAELETIARLELPITVIVFNDSELSLIKIKQQPGHGGDEVVGYRPTDFATVAAGMGLSAERPSSIDKLDMLLSSGWDRPRLIDVPIDPSSYGHLMQVTRG